MLRKVYLEGEIGEKFGKEFEIEANSFGKVIQCLELNFPEFRNLGGRENRIRSHTFARQNPLQKIHLQLKMVMFQF